VATDVAARGLHIEGLEMVVNYDLPNIENYATSSAAPPCRQSEGRLTACDKYGDKRPNRGLIECDPIKTAAPACSPGPGFEPSSQPGGTETLLRPSGGRSAATAAPPGAFRSPEKRSGRSPPSTFAEPAGERNK
jgi:hypothetical protein